jgi:hypothetical protein
MYHCDPCGWDGETPMLREWVGEGCGGVVWTRPVCPACGAEVHQPVILPQPPQAHQSSGETGGTMPPDDHYKGLAIAIVLLPIGGGQFQPQITITHQTGAHVTTRHFSGDLSFDREDDAIRYGLVRGRAIIDGQVEGCSVTDGLDG